MPTASARFTTRSLIAAAMAAGIALPAFAQDEPGRYADAAGGLTLDVPFVPTPPDMVKRMLEVAEVTADDYVMDLGSGDGRIAVAAARDFGARALGVDLDPKRVAEGEENAKEAGVSDKVEFRVQNLFETELEEADVITMYLLPRVNLELRPRLLELEPGTRIVSHAFHMGDWQPDLKEGVAGRTLFYWVVPADVGGQWTVTAGDTTVALDIEQTYQELAATATIGGAEAKVTEATLRGAEISFTVETSGGAQTFTGTVDGDTITPAEGGDWSAKRS